MVIRPLEREPVPRYWVTVMEAVMVSLLLFVAVGTIIQCRLTVEFALDPGLPLEVALDAVASFDDLPELSPCN
jgi:hypothetical protein